MADEFADCRRKDDHSQTHRIPVSSLPYFPDWEPIPEDEQDAGQPPDSAAEDAPAEPKTAPKPASKSTDTTKGRGE